MQSIIAGFLLLALLSGCGKSGDEARFRQFQQLLETAAVTVTAEVTALSDDAVTAFTLTCAESPEGTSVEVLQPEMLAGVRAWLRPGETTLEFDGVALPVPDAPGQVSPLLALPMLLEAVRTGHIDLVWREGDALAVQLILDDETTVRLFFNADNVPVYAEIAANDRTAVQCAITTWMTNEGETEYESNDQDVGRDQS